MAKHLNATRCEECAHLTIHDTGHRSCGHDGFPTEHQAKTDAHGLFGQADSRPLFCPLHDISDLPTNQVREQRIFETARMICQEGNRRGSYSADKAIKLAIAFVDTFDAAMKKDSCSHDWEVTGRPTGMGHDKKCSKCGDTQ